MWKTWEKMMFCTLWPLTLILAFWEFPLYFSTFLLLYFELWHWHLQCWRSQPQRLILPWSWAKQVAQQISVYRTGDTFTRQGKQRKHPERRGRELPQLASWPLLVAWHFRGGIERILVNCSELKGGRTKVSRNSRFCAFPLFPVEKCYLFWVLCQKQWIFGYFCSPFLRGKGAKKKLKFVNN